MEVCARLCSREHLELKKGRKQSPNVQDDPTDPEVQTIMFCLADVLSTGNYVLNYLATRPKLAAFVTQALIQLYARITKLGWFDCQKDDYVFRNVIADVTRFLQVCLCSLLRRRAAGGGSAPLGRGATLSLVCSGFVSRTVWSTASSGSPSSPS